MHTFKKHILTSLAVIVGLFGTDTAHAATEVHSFDATLTSGTLNCGEAVGLETSCPSLFGAIDEATSLDDLIFGMSIGETYPGEITLFYDTSSGTPALLNAACTLNGQNCFFDSEFLPIGSDLLGPAPGILDFSFLSSVESRFNFDTGTFTYSTDFLSRSDGSVFYYFGVNFDLANAEYSVAYSVVPLPASLPLLLASLGGLALLRRRAV